MVLSNLLAGSAPLVGGVIFQMYYGLIESKLDNLDKTHHRKGLSLKIPYLVVIL